MSGVDLYGGGDNASERHSRRRSKNSRRSRPKSTSHKGHRSRSKGNSKGQGSNAQDYRSHTTIKPLKSPNTPVVYSQSPASPESRSSIDSDGSMASFHSTGHNSSRGGGGFVRHGGGGGSRGPPGHSGHGSRGGGSRHHHGHTPSPMGLTQPGHSAHSAHSGHSAHSNSHNSNMVNMGAGGPQMRVDPNVFKFDFDLTRFGASQQHKLKQVRDMGFPNDFLNLVRLYVVNWDVHRVVSKYANFVPNICMKYCIHYICKNKAECEYDHIDELRLPDIVFKNRNYAFGKVFCEYLLTLKKSHFNNLDYSMIYRFYGWAIRQSAQTMNDFKQAEAQFLKAIKFNPNNHYAHNEYALLLHNNFHNYEKAETHYKLSIEINPNHELYQYNYGWFLYDTLKKYQECLPYFKRACELMPRNAHYFYWYGMALLQLNQFGESAEQLKKALSVATQDSDKHVIKERIMEIESKVSLSGMFVPTMKANGVELPSKLNFDEIARNEDKMAQVFEIWYEKCSIAQIMSFIFRFNLNFNLFIKFVETKCEAEKESKETPKDGKFSERNEEALNLLTNVYKLATVFGGKKYNKESGTTTSMDDENVEASGMRPIEQTQESKENEKKILLRMVTGDTASPAHDEKEKDMIDEEKDSNNGNVSAEDLEDFSCEKYEKELDAMDTDINKINELAQSIDFFKDDNSAATEFVRKFNENVKFVEMTQSKLQVVWPQSIQFLSGSVMKCQQLYSATQDEVAAAEEVYNSEINKEFTKNEQKYNDTEKLFFDCFKGARGLEVSKLKSRLAHYEETKSKLTDLVAKYREVSDKAEDSISLLMLKYQQTWEKLESTWHTWDVALIVLWFRFKLLANKGGGGGGPGKNKEIDFGGIEQNMKDADYKGEYLKMIEKTDLRDFGFSNYLDYTKIFKLIREMTKKYPNSNASDADETKSQSELTMENSVSGVSAASAPTSADPKYYCPITSRMFKNPVTAFNGVTYEKQAIIKFWRENGHSFENKDEKIDVELAISMLYPNKQLKAEIEEINPPLSYN